MLTVGKAIRLIRVSIDLRATDLAKRSKISNPMLCLVESEKRSLSLLSLSRIGKVLGVPPEVFIKISQPTLNIIINARSRGILEALKEMDAAEENLRTLIE